MKTPIVAALVALAALPGVAAAEMFRTNGAQIEYHVTGAGPPLLLIHGFGGCAEHTWRAIAPELARSHRVIAINQRGHGGSTAFTGAFSHRQSAEDVANLMDALGIESARAVGFSSGGMTLLHLASRHPRKVSRLVVIGGTTHFGEQARRIMLSAASHGLPPQVRANFEACAENGKAQVDALVRQFGAFKDSYDDVNFQAGDLARISAKTLIVHGDRDEFFPVSIPVAMYQAIPDARLWIVPGGEHSLTAGAPETFFIRELTSFLSPER